MVIQKKKRKKEGTTIRTQGRKIFNGVHSRFRGAKFSFSTGNGGEGGRREESWIDGGERITRNYCPQSGRSATFMCRPCNVQLYPALVDGRHLQRCRIGDGVPCACKSPRVLARGYLWIDTALGILLNNSDTVTSSKGSAWKAVILKRVIVASSNCEIAGRIG